MVRGRYDLLQDQILMLIYHLWFLWLALYQTLNPIDALFLLRFLFLNFCRIILEDFCGDEVIKRVSQTIALVVCSVPRAILVLENFGRW